MQDADYPTPAPAGAPHRDVQSFIYVYPGGTLHSTLSRDEIRRRIDNAVTVDGERAFVELDVINGEGDITTVDYRESLISAVYDR